MMRWMVLMWACLLIAVVGVIGWIVPVLGAACCGAAMFVSDEMHHHRGGHHGRD